MRSQIVSFHCVLRNQLGDFISSTFNRDVITQIEGAPVMLQGLAKALGGLHKGEKRRVRLSAEEAYGFYHPDLVIECSRKEIAKGRLLKVGDEVSVQRANGEMRPFRVVKADLMNVILDANHPLAGQDLIFEIEATDARDATHEEVEESSPRQAEGSLLH